MNIVFILRKKIAFMHDHSHEPPHPDCMAFPWKILFQKNDVIYFTICRFAAVKHVSVLFCRMRFLLDHCIISVDNVLEKGHTVQYNNPLQS